MGKTIQTIALILKNRDDALEAPAFGHDLYWSKGVLKQRAQAEKERLKAEKARAKAELKARKGTPPRAVQESSVPESSQPMAYKLEKQSSSISISMHRVHKSLSVSSSQGAAPLVDPVVLATERDSLRAGTGPVVTRFGVDPSSPAVFMYQSRMGATVDEVAESVRTDKEQESQRKASKNKTVEVDDEEEGQVPRLAVEAPRGPASKATLVICPVVAIEQWRKEIEKHTKPGTLRVLVHHGPKRSADKQDFEGVDVVITSYSVVEAEFRKMISPSKVRCKYCGRVFLPEKLRFHLKYFCGPDAVLTEAQRKQERGEGAPTKAWVAKMLEKRSKSAVKPKTKVEGSTWTGAMGEQEESEPEEEPAEEEEEVFGSSSAAPDDEPPSLGPVSPLQQVYWRRVVLDEAHAIKNLASATARAVLALTAERRWCLSGTPLQNRAGELNALVRFLRVDPFAFYFCSGCNCKSLEYLFRGGVGTCPLCGCSPMRHYSWLGRYVTNPVRYQPGSARALEAMKRLRSDVLPSLLLRRTKAGRAGDMALPCRLMRLRKDRMDAFEDDFYSALYTQSQSQFDTYVTRGTVLNNYAHIFGLLMRLRQAVDHPYLVIYSQSQSLASSSSAAGPIIGSGACAICAEHADDPVPAKCGHVFCRDCVTGYLESLGEIDPEPSAKRSKASDDEPATFDSPTCPACFAPLTVDLSAPEPAVSEVKSRQGILTRVPQSHLGGSFRSSTKIEALLEELSVAQQEEPGCKSIVFSQFTSMLDLVEHRLSFAGVRCVKLDGRMPVKARDRIIERFQTDPSIQGKCFRRVTWLLFDWPWLQFSSSPSRPEESPSTSPRPHAPSFWIRGGTLQQKNKLSIAHTVWGSIGRLQP
jgi:hypothetical protein